MNRIALFRMAQLTCVLTSSALLLACSNMAPNSAAPMKAATGATLCAYPVVATYNGSGSLDDARHFSCKSI
jgi:hypothetical protein